MNVQGVLWVAFGALVAGMIALDLSVFSRDIRAPSTREAGILSLAWIVLALLFGAGVWWLRGREDGLAFLTGYILEKALSLDNLFVFLLLFGQFGVPAHLQPRVLKWGILGAVLMRAGFIVGGVALIHAVEWITYVFGVLIIWAGIRMARGQPGEVALGGLPILRMLRGHLPPAPGDAGAARPREGAFIVRRGWRLYVTPLLAVLILVELTDLIFAVDSVPAILAVTTDPFLAYTSNVFAILGLRALYFLLAGAMGLFRYLKPSLAVILTFVGLKMLLADVYPIPLGVMLGLVVSILGGSVTASLLHRPARAA